MFNPSKIKGFLGGLKTNFAGGVRVNKKVIIIESDDWGAIRTPSLEALHAFAKHGFELNKSIYKNDALASGSDLDDLFNLLLSHRNQYGKSPVFTANAIMANPDFKKIRESNFNEYFFEAFSHTFEHYPEHKNNLDLWKRGEEEGIFIPEYHGREHLNICRWLKALQSGDEKLLYSFDWQCTYSGNEDYAFMEAYDWDNPSDVKKHELILNEGAQIFHKTFGRSPRSFIAPCYNWDPGLEGSISSLGVEWIQGSRFQLVPTGKFNRYRTIKHFFGESNGFSSLYNLRNVYFEPADNPNFNWTDRAMARIQAAFLVGKPAVISSHRVNYIGFINPNNKANGLKHLDSLLKAVLKKWPEVEFISTSELSNYIKHR